MKVLWRPFCAVCGRALTWALVEEKQNPLMVSAYAGVSLRTIQRVYLKVLPEHTREIASCIKV